MDAQTIKIFTKPQTNLEVSLQCWFYQKPFGNQQGLRQNVYTYTNNKNGQDIENVISNVNPFVVFSYTLPVDENGNTQRPTWNNTMYLTRDHIHDLKVMFRQLDEMLSDVEAFTVSETGKYSVGPKYLNTVVGMQCGAGTISGRLYAYQYTKTDAITSTEATASGPGVALTLSCGNGNSNIFKLNEFYSLYESIMSINLEQYTIECTNTKYLEMLISKMGVGTKSNYQSNNQHKTYNNSYQHQGTNLSVGTITSTPKYGTAQAQQQKPVQKQTFSYGTKSPYPQVGAQKPVQSQMPPRAAEMPKSAKTVDSLNDIVPQEPDTASYDDIDIPEIDM